MDSSTKNPGQLIVLGSANRDYTVVVERHPKPGETVLGGAVVVGTGGKGANQAAAAARAGAKPIFVGAVGNDSTADDILSDLKSVGVDVSRMIRSDVATGVALITVSRDGENAIVVAAGANGSLEPAATASTVAELVSPGAVLLAQLEIPVEVVAAAASVTEQNGGRFVLNLSPIISAPTRMLTLSDPLIVNESEASELANSRIESPVDAEAVAKRLQSTSRSVVITLGGDGVVVADSDGVYHLQASQVPVVDTTGAGDAFAGTLAATLAAGASLRAAVTAGIAAGAEAVQYVGAQPPRET
ncbi:MAG: ribokinase [Actinomycetota bacterium]|nr:ribokinase [Actinomycetota bacterium]